MKGILPDINAGKHIRALMSVWNSDSWRDLWYGLGLAVASFPALGLAYDAADADVWRTCQKEGLVLITGNRNNDASDSLEAVIRDENLAISLPVITIANPDRVLRDRFYAELVAERLLEQLFAIDSYRGAGRIYVP